MSQAPAEAGTGGQRSVRFGPFELSLESRELRKHRVRVRLQSKPFHILTALLEEPGHVVTREELRRRLWPAHTFVDFESGLNTAVNRLRIALGDSAENPIYIETLARLGYRFIAPVTVSNAAPIAPVLDVEIKRIEKRKAVPSDVPALPENLISVSKRKWPLIAGVAGSVALILFVVVLTRESHSDPSFRQITFRKGIVSDARFSPDGGSVIYSAEWNGEPSRVFLGNLVSPEARDLGFQKTSLASLSPTAELALFVQPSDNQRDSKQMSLERVPLNGGAPRLISNDAMAADWAPDGSLCIVRGDFVASLEFPAGRKLYVSHGYITNPRVSPQGDRVAFLEHPIFDDDGGQVVVVYSSGEWRVLSSGWASARGLAWQPSGREIWFTAARSGGNRALMAVDLGGRVRQIAHVPGALELQDIAPSGKVLIDRATQRVSMFLANLNGNSQRDISWLDWSRTVAITADGKRVLFDESGEGGGKQYSAYLYKTDTGSAERLGDGRAMDLSPDGQWAITQNASDSTNLTLVATGRGQSKPLPKTGVEYRWVKFFPNGKEILVSGNYPRQAPRIYRQTLPYGKPILVKTGLRLGPVVIDPKGQIAVGCDNSQPVILDLRNGDTRQIKTSRCVDPVNFVDPNTVLATYEENDSILFELLDLTTGSLTPYGRFTPPDSAGLHTLELHVANDLRTFVYSRVQYLSDLFVVSGWK